MAVKKTQTKTITRKPTVEETILGHKEEKITVTEFDYDNKNTKYIVTIIKNGRKIDANGLEIDFYLGLNNEEARNDLKSGKTETIAKNSDGENIYKIEVQ